MSLDDQPPAMDAPARTRTISVLSPDKKLVLFCNHPLAQKEFTHLLKRAGFEVVSAQELRLPDQASDRFETLQPPLAVIDAGSPAASLELARTLRRQQSTLNVLVLLPSFEDSITFPMLRLGVKGLLMYPQTQRELCRAAHQVSAGGYWVPRELLTRFVESILPELHHNKSLDLESGISRRGREVLDLLLDNLSNKEIANKLFVSERTIKFHVSNLLHTFGVQRRADLIVLWMQRSGAQPHPYQDSGRSASAHVN